MRSPFILPCVVVVGNHELDGNLRQSAKCVRAARLSILHGHDAIRPRYHSAMIVNSQHGNDSGAGLLTVALKRNIISGPDVAFFGPPKASVASEISFVTIRLPFKSKPFTDAIESSGGDGYMSAQRTPRRFPKCLFTWRMRLKLHGALLLPRPSSLVPLAVWSEWTRLMTLLSRRQHSYLGHFKEEEQVRKAAPTGCW